MKNILSTLPSPCWLLEEEKLQKNLELISDVKQQSWSQSITCT